jgi:hypothetical protein
MPSLLTTENAMEMYRGTSKTFILEITDEEGAVVNLTGSTIYFTVKDSIDAVNPLIQKKSSDALQIDIYDPVGGKAKIYLDPADTQALALKPRIFDVWVVLTSGKRYVVIPPSDFVLKPSVTVIPVS